MRPSVLSQKFLRVDDVQVGEVVKGTVRKLTGTALFVKLNGNVDGMVWPTHYADIMLKHPQKRFQPDANIKCRVRTAYASILTWITEIQCCRFWPLTHLESEFS